MRVDRNSAVLLHRQVYDALQEDISRGKLAAGARLPSTRGLARRLGVSRNTVLAAYYLLAADGYLEGVVGSGTRVRGGASPVRLPDPHTILRQSQYPSRTIPLADTDGHPIYLQKL